MSATFEEESIMFSKRVSRQLAFLVLGFVLVALAPAPAQEKAVATTAPQSGAEKLLSVPAGSAMEVEGHITGKENRSLSLNTMSGAKLLVAITGGTQIKEKIQAKVNRNREYISEDRDQNIKPENSRNEKLVVVVKRWSSSTGPKPTAG